MNYLNIDEILTEEERIPSIFLLDGSGLGHLDTTNDLNDLPSNSKIDLPLWLTTILVEKNMIEIELPKHYGSRIREDIMASAIAVPLREYSYYYFEVGWKLSKLTRDNDLRKTLRIAFTGDRYKALMARSLANWHDDLADYTHNLTASELKLFQYGYTAAKEILSWRSGHSNVLVAASILGKHGINDSSNKNGSNNVNDGSIKRGRFM